MIVPAQAVEGRNRPQGDRAAGFLRENARTLNEPVNRVATRNTSNEAEKRWWEWNLPVESGNNVSLKKRSLSSSNLSKAAADVEVPGFQTTYQKDHGYLRTAPAVRVGSVNENQGGAARHTYNPNGAHAVGIIPINDLNNYSKQQSNGGGEQQQQRVFADKMSFEHAYDARKESNYAQRGKRQGAYVIEQIEPKPALGLRTHVDRNKGASVWDAMHLDESPITRLPPTAPVARHSATNDQQQYRNQRRDPIGYYEDPKFGAPKPDMPSSAPVAHHHHQPAAAQQQPSYAEAANNVAQLPDDISYQTKALAYNPTWSNVNADFQLQRLKQTQQQLMNEVHSANGANELLDQAMMYQRPMINGH